MNRLGVATIDITPPPGLELAGYGRGGPSEGVLDRLEATSFFVTDGERGVSLTSVDLLGLGMDMASEVRDRIAARLGIDRAAVLLLATHTHSGPFPLPVDPAGAGYLDGLPDELVEVAVSAAAAPFPCLVSWSVDEIAIGENRREVGPDGTVIMGRNPDGVVDRRLGTLRFHEPDTGELVGLLALVTAHANVLKHDSNVVSGDYPARARRMVSGALGCPAMVVIGSAGDINAVWRGTRNDVQRMAWAVCSGVLRQLAEQPGGGTSVPVSAASRVLEASLVPLPDAATAQALAEESEREWQRDIAPWLELVERERSRGVTQPMLPLEVTIARIGDWVLGGVPMETFSGTALAAAATLESDVAFLCGYTNGYLGYLPTAEEFERGGYEVRWSPVVYGPQTGLFLPMVPETADSVAATFTALATDLAGVGTVEADGG